MVSGGDQWSLGVISGHWGGQWSLCAVTSQYGLASGHWGAHWSLGDVQWSLG